VEKQNCCFLIFCCFIDSHLAEKVTLSNAEKQNKSAVAGAFD